MLPLEMKEIMNIVAQLMGIPYPRVWSSYDKEADVLYLNFKKPSHSDDSELTDDGVIIRYEKKKSLG